MIEIREVKSIKEKRLFLVFNADMYRNVEAAVPDIIYDEKNYFNSKKNSAYKYCKVKRFLAFKDGKCVGRIAGIINYKANEKWTANRVRFTRADFIDDNEVSAALFSAVENWGKTEGMTEIQGPLGFTDFDQEGMLIEGFDRPGPFFTIYNYPYYVDHMKRLGYDKDVDWLEYRIKVPYDESNERMKRITETVLKRFKLHLVEPKNRKGFKTYLPQVFKLLNEAYKELYGMVEFDEAQMESLLNQFAMLINPDYLKLIYDEKEELVGFGLAVPSLNSAIKKHRGRLFPFGWYAVLRAPYRKAETLDLCLVGVKPEMQKLGVPAALLYSMTESAKKNGVMYAETGPELETNESVKSLWKFYEAEQHKRRRCWFKAL